MKTITRNGKKYVVTDALYSSIKKSKILEGINPYNDRNVYAADVVKNAKKEVDDYNADPKNKEDIDLYDTAVQEIEKVRNNLYTKEALRKEYGNEADIFISFLNNLIMCIKDKGYKMDAINIMKERNLPSDKIKDGILGLFMQYDPLGAVGKLNNNVGERKAKEFISKLYMNINGEQNTDEEQYSREFREYDEICEKIINEEDPDKNDNGIYSNDAAKFVSQLWTELGKDPNDSNFNDKVALTIRDSLYNRKVGVQVIMKLHREEICNEVFKNKNLTAEEIEDAIRKKIEKELLKPDYVEGIISNLENEFNKDKKWTKKKKKTITDLVKNYLTAIARHNYTDKGDFVDTSDEEKNEVKPLETLDNGYVTFVSIYKDGGLIQLSQGESTKNDESENNENSDTATIYVDSKGTKKTVNIKKDNDYSKALVVPESKFFTFTIDGTDLVFNKTKEGKELDSNLDSQNDSSVVSNNVSTEKGKQAFRDKNDIRLEIKDNIVNFVKDNKDFFGPHRIIAIVFDNAKHVNPIDEFVIDLQKNESLRFRSLPAILTAVKDENNDEIIDLNPIIVEAFHTWRNYIESHTPENINKDQKSNNVSSDKLFDTTDAYNNMVDKITNKLTTINNLYMNTRNIKDTSEISKNVINNITNLEKYKKDNNSNTVEYCKQLLLCINDKTRDEKFIKELIAEDKKKSNADIDKKRSDIITKEIKTLKILYDIDKEQYYGVYQALTKYVNAAKEGVEKDIKSLISALSNVFSIKDITNSNKNNSLYAKYYSYMLTKILKITLDNDIHTNYDKLSDNGKSEFNKMIKGKFGKSGEDESADDILEYYLYYTDEYPSEDDIEKYKQCFDAISNYSSDIHSIMEMLKARMAEERIASFQYLIKPLSIQDYSLGNFLKAFLTGRKLVSVNDLLKIKSIENSQIGQALKYSFLVEYYDKKKLGDKKEHKKAYDNIIKEIVESTDGKLDRKTISDKCLREIIILSGDYDTKRFISSLREIDDFNKSYTIEDFQSKKYGNDNNNITTASIMKGHNCIGYMQIYRIFGTIRGIIKK